MLGKRPSAPRVGIMYASQNVDETQDNAQYSYEDYKAKRHKYEDDFSGSFEWLPDEIQKHILSFLDQCNIGKLVCKNWYHTITKLNNYNVVDRLDSYVTCASGFVKYVHATLGAPLHSISLAVIRVCSLKQIAALRKAFVGHDFFHYPQELLPNFFVSVGQSGSMDMIGLMRKPLRHILRNDRDEEPNNYDNLFNSDAGPDSLNANDIFDCGDDDDDSDVVHEYAWVYGLSEDHYVCYMRSLFIYGLVRSHRNIEPIVLSLNQVLNWNLNQEQILYFMTHGHLATLQKCFPQLFERLGDESFEFLCEGLLRCPKDISEICRNLLAVIKNLQFDSGDEATKHDTKATIPKQLLGNTADLQTYDSIRKSLFTNGQIDVELDDWHESTLDLLFTRIFGMCSNVESYIRIVTSDVLQYELNMYLSRNQNDVCDWYRDHRWVYQLSSTRKIPKLCDIPTKDQMTIMLHLFDSYSRCYEDSDGYEYLAVIAIENNVRGFFRHPAILQQMHDEYNRVYIQSANVFDGFLSIALVLAQLNWSLELRNYLRATFLSLKDMSVFGQVGSFFGCRDHSIDDMLLLFASSLIKTGNFGLLCEFLFKLKSMSDKVLRMMANTKDADQHLLCKLYVDLADNVSVHCYCDGSHYASLDCITLLTRPKTEVGLMRFMEYVRRYGRAFVEAIKPKKVLFRFPNDLFQLTRPLKVKEVVKEVIKEMLASEFNFDLLEIAFRSRDSQMLHMLHDSITDANMDAYMLAKLLKLVVLRFYGALSGVKRGDSADAFKGPYHCALINRCIIETKDLDLLILCASLTVDLRQPILKGTCCVAREMQDQDFQVSILRQFLRANLCKKCGSFIDRYKTRPLRFGALMNVNAHHSGND